MRTTTLLTCAALALAGCGGSQHEAEHAEVDMDIGEARAIQIIADTLQQAGIAPGAGWVVDIGAERPLDVDVRLANGHFGIEYVTAQDRIDYGASLPPVRDGQLMMVAGRGDSADAQILLLDERQYTYDPHGEHVEQGESSAADAEGRLARDVRDFIQNVRGAGGP